MRWEDEALFGIELWARYEQCFYMFFQLAVPCMAWALHLSVSVSQRWTTMWKVEAQPCCISFQYGLPLEMPYFTHLLCAPLQHCLLVG